MAGPYNIYGDFKGLFKTKQSTAIGAGDNPPHNLDHTVQVYQGVLKAEQFFEEFKPQDYRKLGSFVLLNVPNISVVSDAQGSIAENQLFTFSELILIEPEILRVYELNGETYGELKSKAYGRTFQAPQLTKLKPDSFDSTGYSDRNQWVQRQEGCINQSYQGCGKLFQGCLQNFWKILWFLVLCLLLFGLIRACNSIIHDQEVCNKAEQARKNKEQLERELKKIKEQYDQNLMNTLKNMSTIYFYRNSTDLHANSSGLNGTLDRLANVIQTYDDRSFVLVGHCADNTVELEGIAELRAKKVKDLLINKGIIGNRLTIQLKGSSEAKPLPLYQFMEKDGIREYNANMKVTVVVNKNSAQ